jgi:hypothetical protein
MNNEGSAVSGFINQCCRLFTLTIKYIKMKSAKFYLLSLAALLPAVFYAQTADDIINKHIEAIGGKDKLSAINAVRFETTMQVMDNDAANKIVILNGKGYRSDMDFNGQSLVQVYTDKGGWAINPFGGDGQQTPMPDDEYKAGASQIYAVPLLNYASRGGKAELLGQEKVGNADAYKIKITDEKAVATTYFIDASNHYIVKTIRPAYMMGQVMDIVTTYSGFSKSEYGWVFAKNMELDYGGQFSMAARVDKVEVNAPVDAAVFEMRK